jgi:hypothetical protein
MKCALRNAVNRIGRQQLFNFCIAGFDAQFFLSAAPLAAHQAARGT